MPQQGTNTTQAVQSLQISLFAAAQSHFNSSNNAMIPLPKIYNIINLGCAAAHPAPVDVTVSKYNLEAVPNPYYRARKTRNRCFEKESFISQLNMLPKCNNLQPAVQKYFTFASSLCTFQEAKFDSNVMVCPIRMSYIKSLGTESISMSILNFHFRLLDLPRNWYRTSSPSYIQGKQNFLFQHGQTQQNLGNHINFEKTYNTFVGTFFHFRKDCSVLGFNELLFSDNFIWPSGEGLTPSAIRCSDL